MGAILGVGLTDYPYMFHSDLVMSRSLQQALMSERVLDKCRDTRSWPSEMREAWGHDMGQAAAREARSVQVAQFQIVRAAIDAFRPDAIVLIAKDHHETTPSAFALPYSLYALEEYRIRPFSLLGPAENVFGEQWDREICVPGARSIGISLWTELSNCGQAAPFIDQPLTDATLAHPFRSAVVHLDWTQRQCTVPMVALPVSPFGCRSRDVTGLAPTTTGTWGNLTCAMGFNLGRHLGRAILATRFRIALVVAAGWSHANNTSWDRSWLWPDVEADRRLFERWRAGDLAALGELGQEELEEHGQWELASWAVVAGAMHEVQAKIEHSHFQPTWIFNSNWVTTIFGGVEG